MDNRKWQANAAASPPTPPASPSVGYPTNGGVSTPVTSPGDWMWYALTEEIRNVIVAAGLTPDNTVNQLLLALGNGYGMAKNHAANGYQKLPGGLILQWAAGVGVSTESSQTITFPITYPNAHFLTVVSTKVPTGASSNNGIYQLVSVTVSACVVFMQGLNTLDSTLHTPNIISIGN